MARTITLPVLPPRPYQQKAWAALDSGIRNVLSIAHRRSGKDISAINYTAKAAHVRTGVYWHMLPYLKQARQAIWEGRDNEGRSIIDTAFPPDLVKRKRNDDMMIELKCGSVWRMLGADSWDGNVGANPVGVCFSEAALMSPLGMQYIRPILVANKGWMWLNSTYRGKNWLWELEQKNKGNKDWFVEKYNILDTGVMTKEEVDKEIASGLMTAARAAQEYYCDADAADEGSIYGKQMEDVERTQRIGTFPYDPRYPVETAWDIGMLDKTAIWFIQRVGSEIRVIDYYEASREFLPHYAAVIHSKPYGYSRHIFPHDLERDHWGAGTSTDEMTKAHGIIATVAPKMSVDEGIGAVRAILPRMTFNASTTHQGVAALKHYHRKWDEEDRVYSKPVHDWASDACDALRMYAVTPEGLGMVADWAKDFVKRDSGLYIPRPQYHGQVPQGGYSMQWQPKKTDHDNYDPLAMYG